LLCRRSRIVCGLSRCSGALYLHRPPHRQMPDLSGYHHTTPVHRMDNTFFGQLQLTVPFTVAGGRRVAGHTPRRPFSHHTARRAAGRWAGLYTMPYSSATCLTFSFTLASHLPVRLRLPTRSPVACHATPFIYSVCLLPKHFYFFCVCGLPTSHDIYLQGAHTHSPLSMSPHSTYSLGQRQQTFCNTPHHTHHTPHTAPFSLCPTPYSPTQTSACSTYILWTFAHHLTPTTCPMDMV